MHRVLASLYLMNAKRRKANSRQDSFYSKISVETSESIKLLLLSLNPYEKRLLSKIIEGKDLLSGEAQRQNFEDGFRCGLRISNEIRGGRKRNTMQ